jgi:pilus assembly protein Flp/PilA
MKNTLKSMIAAQDGQDLVEYALLVAIVALGCVAALNAFSTAITSAWTAISTMLSS